MIRRPSDRTVKRELKRLRAIIEDPKRTVLEQRVAYTIEYAVRWARDKHSGWTKPSAEVDAVVKCIQEGL